MSCPMRSYRCTVCGYVYDPELGDIENCVDSWTPFEDVPDTWKCPVCGNKKTMFEIID